MKLDKVKYLADVNVLIALLDEESEQMEIDIDKIKEILSDLKTMLNADDETEFSFKYKLAKADNEIIFQFDKQIKTEL